MAYLLVHTSYYNQIPWFILLCGSSRHSEIPPSKVLWLNEAPPRFRFGLVLLEDVLEGGLPSSRNHLSIHPRKIYGALVRAAQVYRNLMSDGGSAPGQTGQEKGLLLVRYCLSPI